MEILLNIHSFVRWLVVALGILAIIKLGYGWLRQAQFSPVDRGLVSSFSGLVDLQVLSGVILLVWTGLLGAGFPRPRIEHTITMIIAAVIAHLPMLWRSAIDQIRYRNTTIAILGTLVLIFFGVWTVGGWG